MPQLDLSTFAPQLIWLAITFFGLYMVMWKVVLPRIGAAIEQRRSKIADDLDAAQQLKQDTEKAIAAYEAALAEARARAHAIAQETRDRLKGEIEAERARVDGEVAGKVAEAEQAIAASRDRALAEVKSLAADIAGEIVDQLIGLSVTRQDVQRAVERASAAPGG